MYSDNASNIKYGQKMISTAYFNTEISYKKQRHYYTVLAVTRQGSSTKYFTKSKISWHIDSKYDLCIYRLKTDTNNDE